MMKYGFVRVAAASPRLRVADVPYNASQIVKTVKELAQDGVQVAVFPELCLTGSTCGDLFLQQPLLQGAVEGLKTVLEETADLSMVLSVGMPLNCHQKLYDCVVLLCAGRILGVVPKQHLANHGESAELRHFAPGRRNGTVSLCGQEVPFGTRLLFECADMPELVLAAELDTDLWAAVTPSMLHAQAGATLILNSAAGCELVGKADYRRELVKSQSARLLCGYVFANAGEGESTTDLVFAGHNLIAENGKLLEETKLFSGKTAVADLDLQRLCAERRRANTFVVDRTGYEVVSFELKDTETFTRTIPQMPFIPEEKAERDARCSAILEMQAAGLRKRVAHTNSSKLVIGVSGGLDSTLALLVAAKVLDSLNRPRTDLMAITMPCFGTTARTKGNAERLCEALGADLRCVNITAAVRQHFADIGQDEANTDVTYENSQARERTQVLMDMANQCNGMVVGTGDLSELALGWATYNGDHMSMYGVNGAIPKTLVRHLVAYAAEQSGDALLSSTLRDILDTPVSPELLPAKDGVISQKTEDLVGPYELHDFFLYYVVRCGFTAEKIYWMACRAFAGEYDAETIRKWLDTFLRRFFAQQFKRSCLPDGPKVGSVGFSPRGDWQMPSDALGGLWRAPLQK